MAKMILLKVTGDDRVFMVNLDSLTVEAVEGADLGTTEAGSAGVDFAMTGGSRSDAASHAFYGVDRAVAAGTRSDAASHAFYGIDSAVAADTRSDAASHAFFSPRANA